MVRVIAPSTSPDSKQQSVTVRARFVMIGPSNEIQKETLSAGLQRCRS
jgi:hypothetical protein